MPTSESKITLARERLWRVGKLRREASHGFGVDVALVPFLEDGEVWTSGLPVLALLPAVALQEVGRRCQNVGRAAQEVAAAVGIEIDREFDVVRRHKLGLAEFTSPSTAHFGGTQVAAVDDPERIQQFAAE